MHIAFNFQTTIGLLASGALSLPHDQMVNNEFTRDVGVLYPQVNFAGEPLFLVTHKKQPKCETVNLSKSIIDGTLGSVQICVPSTCIFYKAQAKDCTMSEQGDSDAFFFEGPIDIENLQVACNSYMCGSIEKMAGMVGNAIGVTANSESGDHGAVSHQ